MKNTILIAMSAAAAISLSGCATIADMAGADSQSLNMAAAQGFNQTVEQARSNKTLDTSSSTYRRINAVFVKMIPYADQQNTTGIKFDWKLAVLKSDTVNAYVAPGGKVVFYTAIVDKLKLTDAEIAAVMGHEMVHALEEHSKSKVGADTLTSLAVGIGKSYAGDRIGEMGSAAIDLGSQVGVGLPYSRNLESRADQGGLMMMARAGYDPKAAISLWEKMSKLDGGANGPAFMSTHPSSSKRIDEMRKNLAAAQAVYKK